MKYIVKYGLLVLLLAFPFVVNAEDTSEKASSTERSKSPAASSEVRTSDIEWITSISEVRTSDIEVIHSLKHARQELQSEYARIQVQGRALTEQETRRSETLQKVRAL